MVAERLFGIVEPGENPAIALIDLAPVRTDVDPADNLLDQRTFAVGWKRGQDLLVVQDPGGDQRAVPRVAFGSQGIEIGEVGHWVDQPPNHQQLPQHRCDDEEDGEHPGSETDKMSRD